MQAKATPFPAALNSPPTSAPGPLPRLRWMICGLLFFATTINYIDRQVLSLLKPVLEKELGWNESQYGWIVFGFQLSYGLMMPLAGRLLDWLGTRLGYLLAVTLWSVAAMLHSLAGSAAQFGLARFALGFGESANFPAALKTVTNWFPRRERALATGTFNSGSNIGAVVAPLVVPYLALHYGWRSAFIATGAIGFLWLILWAVCYREPNAVEKASLQSGEEEAPAEPLPYSHLLRSRTAWAYTIGKFLTDPVWWFYLFWLPGFLNRVYGLDLSNLGLPLIVVYQAASIGSIGGGWISSALLKRGWTVNRARKTAMLICALSVTGVIFVKNASNVWVAVALVSLGAAGHQGWSANLFTLPTDVFRRDAVASAIGLGGMGGAICGLLVSPAVGHWLDFSHGAYGPLFVAAGSIYLVALLIIHLLVPKLEAAS
jgi:MFS transporter, ACS family, aldohexuronate transporter